MANGGMVKGKDGYWADSIVGAGQLTMQEIENELLEVADESGVSKKDDNFNMKEDGDGSAD